MGGSRKKIQASRSSQILDLKNKLNRIKNNENQDLDVDELVSTALSKWDRIVDDTISSSINDVSCINCKLTQTLS